MVIAQGGTKSIVYTAKITWGGWRDEKVTDVTCCKPVMGARDTRF